MLYTRAFNFNNSSSITSESKTKSYHTIYIRLHTAVQEHMKESLEFVLTLSHIFTNVKNWNIIIKQNNSKTEIVQKVNFVNDDLTMQ